MRVFIVHAHHEPKSFNSSLTREGAAALTQAGHEVVISDLYAMNFNPVSDRRNFVTVKNPHYLQQQAEEIHAAENSGFASDIQAEMDKLFWCDALILQFPLWWFGLPAILKGWVDRVFAIRRAYGGGKYYNHGPFRGRIAMCSLTTGSMPAVYSEHGRNGTLSALLFPINHGMLYFTGFEVLEPFVVHAPARLSYEERQEHLARYRERLLQLNLAQRIEYRKLEEYDDHWVLKKPVGSLTS